MPQLHSSSPASIDQPERSAAADGSEAVSRSAATAPHRNSQHANPLRSDGEKRGSAAQNTYRRQNTPENTPTTAAERRPERAEHPLRAPKDGPEVARDRQAVLHLVRMRLLSTDQLARLTYFGANKTVARRRLRRLRDQGWINLWQRPVSQAGGIPRYAHPTRRAFEWGHAVSAAAADGTVLDPLVQLMLPRTPRQPWKLESGVTPMFLAHTEETNDVLIAWLRRSGERVLWASSWDCPFPEHVEWRAMPQPDYVLVAERASSPQLVFGEHDRGTEGKEIVAQKLRTYRTWFDNPEIAHRTFGFGSFHVVVTVAGERAPRRLDQLTQLVRDEGAEGFTTLLLAGSETVPVLPSFTSPPMDFTHCSFCRTRVPLDAEVCPSCGAPTHELAREELTAEASPPPMDYAAEFDTPDVETPPSSPPPQPPP